MLDCDVLHLIHTLSLSLLVDVFVGMHLLACALEVSICWDVL
jgi:hypothetical protein